MRTLMRLRLSIVAALLMLGLPIAAEAAAADDVLVFAAASLKNALDDAVTAFAPQGGGKVTVSYAASSALAKQIESGAPADIFISADLDWMDYLQQRHLIKAETRQDLLGNRLVLIAPAAKPVTVEIKPNFPLAALLGNEHLAIADPDTVPAGKYAKAALEKLGVWASVVDRLARTENVRAALFFVSRGEAPLGIVYQTDAAADPGVRIAGAFPEDSHPRIVYPIALTAATKNPAASQFLGFLESAAARPIFEKQGFVVLAPPTPTH